MNNKSDLELLIKQNIVLELDNFILSLLLATLLSLLIQYCYLKYSNSLSNKLDFSKNFVMLGIATTIVITIVKSSLALSLGLVGALSIVRFRAAIKEPEELVYLFLIIATGLGCGAGQIKLTAVGIIFALIVTVVYYKLSNKKLIKFSDKLSIAVIADKELNEKERQNIINILNNNCDKVELISYSVSSNNTTINTEVSLESFDKINKILNNLEKKEKYNVVIAKSAHNPL